MRLQCAWAVLLVVLPLCLTASEAPLEGEVTLLQEEPKERVYPYRKWSLDAGALANSDFPALPAEPVSKDPEMELEKWAMKRGMNNKYYKARGIHAVHQAKREEEDADIARNKLIEKVESESLEKAERAELLKSTSGGEGVPSSAPPNPAAEAAANAKSQKLKMEREVAEDTAQQMKSKALELDAKQMAEAAGAANGDDLFLQLGEEPTVLVKSGSSLHRAASTRVFVKDGSSLHHSAGTSIHVKEGSSLHAHADEAPAKEQTQEEKQHEELASKLSAENSDPNEGTTRYYGKKDEDLHKKDPLYDTNSIPDVLQRSARNSVEQLATSVVKKSGGDALDAGYTNAVIASAVAAAAPKIARLQHQANVAAALKLRDAKATARATIESAKKNEEKEEAAAEAAQNAAQAHDAAVANQVVASAGQPAVL